MYRSDDHGTTWTKLLPVSDIAKFTYLKTFGTSGVLLGTEGDGLLQSTDKGNSWSRIDGKNFDTVTCIAVTSIGEIAAGTNRGLWVLDSSKRNWSKVQFGHYPDLYIGALDVSKTDDFYVGTYGASIWLGSRHYSTTVRADVPYPVMKISPNPASERMTVDLDVPEESKISLELYDMLGRKVEVVAEGIYSGEHKLTLNTSNLSSGIYTVVLSGMQNQIQKVIINH